MLVRLLKYDLKYMIKNMGIFYILSVIFAVMTRIFFSLGDSAMITVISQICVGCMFSMVVNTLINTLMRSWVRFREAIYKDEAYLTHTLPVSKNNIYDSKFILTLIFFIISFAVIVLSLFIAYYTKERWQMLKEFLSTFSKSMSFSTSLFVISFLGIIFLEIFNALQCGFLGTLLGHRRENNKLGFSVIFGFIAYLVSQSIVLLLVFIYGLFDERIMDLFKSSMEISPASYKLLATLAAIVYIIIITVMWFVCRKVLNKGVNIE